MFHTLPLCTVLFLAYLTSTAGMVNGLIRVLATCPYCRYAGQVSSKQYWSLTTWHVMDGYEDAVGVGWQFPHGKNLVVSLAAVG